MQRRELFKMVGSTSLVSALAPLSLTSTLTTAMAAAESPSVSSAKPYGSGHFGEWMTDDHGAPAYRYTCDQLRDPVAVAPTDLIFRGATDQWHQIGNNRLVATASNFGYVQVRQDEGGPKFLNEYIPTEGEFGGGLGFLSDGQHVLSTFYSGEAARFERVFGLGYYRKTVSAHGLSIDQWVFAPFGDDPVLLTQSVIRNVGAVRKNLRWTEYWSCRAYDFFEARGDSCTQTEQHFLRRIFAKRFKHRFESLHGGILDRKTYLRSQDDYQVGPGGSRSRDITPPSTFLIPLGD